MNVERLERALVVMQEIADSEQPKVNMGSIRPPECDTPGCHAGLWYLTLKQLGVEVKDEDDYDYKIAAKTMLDWLDIPYHYNKTYDDFISEDEPKPILECWPYGREKAKEMFSYRSAFGSRYMTFPSQVIVDTWQEALKNYKGETT